MNTINVTRQTISDWFYLYSDDVYRFLIYRLGTHDVEDLVQETFIKAINGLDSFNENAHPKTWLFSIARHLAIDEIRKRKRKKWKDFVPFDSKHEGETRRTPESELILNSECEIIHKAINEMKPKYRDVFILRSIQELTIKETASVLHWSEPKVLSTYHRARKALQKKLGGVIDGLQVRSFR